MVRYNKKNLIDLKKASIWKNWIMIALILMFGFVNVNAEQRCCYSTSSQMSSTSVNTYSLNVTASHVDSKKAGNLYYVAISFQPGYTVIGDPYSPFSKVTCSLTSGTVPQYNCQSRDTKTFFIVFDLSIQPTPPPNSTITASSVFIFSDKCQNVAFCTNLAEKNESEDNDKISLGPLGTWPKYAVIIGGVILGLTLLVACYLVYRRNRPDDSYRDRSITPGTSYNDKNRIFSPNSLLRRDGDDDSPPHDEPPKNTLIQFGNVSAHSPERSKSVKSVKNRNHQSTTLSKSPTKKKREKNNHEIEIKSDDDVVDDKIPSVIIDMSNNNNNNNNNNNGSNNLERSKSHKSRKSNNSKDNNNVNRLSGYSTSDMSKTISNNDISDRELSDNNNDELYSSNKNKFSSSTSLHRSKSKLRNSVEESRSDRRPSNNNHNNNNSHNNSRPHRRSTSKGVEEDRDGHKIDRTNSRRHRSHSGHRRSTSKGVEEDRDDHNIDRTNSRRHRSHSRNSRSTSKDVEEDRDDHKIDHSNSRRHRSHSRSRKNSSPPPLLSKSTSDLQRSLSIRTRQTDRDLTSKNKKSFSDDKEVGKNNRPSGSLNRKRSIRHKDLISNADTESTTSSSDVPLGDRLPLAMLVTKLPPSGQSNSRKPDKVIVEEDDDTTPLGRIGSFGASQSRLLSTDKSSNKQSLEDDTNDFYDSILNEVLGITDYQNTEDDKISDDDDPIGKSLSNINKENEKKIGTVNDEEIPIGQLRSS